MGPSNIGRKFDECLRLSKYFLETGELVKFE
jgi:hypothetical protein